jgi:NADH:ubiquinone oxidoreductase subunit 4 (subunit M)
MHTSRSSSCRNRSNDITIFHGFASRVFIGKLRNFHGWSGFDIFSYGATFAVMTLIWHKIYSIIQYHTVSYTVSTNTRARRLRQIRKELHFTTRMHKLH